MLTKFLLGLDLVSNEMRKFSQLFILFPIFMESVNNYTGKEDLRPIMDNGKVEEQKMTGNILFRKRNQMFKFHILFELK